MGALNAHLTLPRRCFYGALAIMGLAIALAQDPTQTPSEASPSSQTSVSSNVQSRGSPTSPLLLYYAFNETAGSSQVIDYSGNKFNATGHGWPSILGTSTPSFTGTSMRLRSLQGQHLSIDKALGPVIKTLDSFTVTTNIRFPQMSPMERPRIFNFGIRGDTTSMALFSYDLWGYGQTYYMLNPNQPGKERNCRAPTSFIDFTAWYSIALTYDGNSTTARTYRDGALVATCPNFPYPPSDQPLMTSLFIGRSTHQYYPEYLDAEFRCFRMYNRALSAEELRRDPCYTGPASPTSSPSSSPSRSPSASPSATPLRSSTPTKSPSGAPSASPQWSFSPSLSPSSSPSSSPSAPPSATPSSAPTSSPTELPSASPSSAPSSSPSSSPSGSPSAAPSSSPSQSPSGALSASPSLSPSSSPSSSPLTSPSAVPSFSPSQSPSAAPSGFPSLSPSSSPFSTNSTSASTQPPPSAAPSSSPSQSPTAAPSASPSLSPSSSPSSSPLTSPSATVSSAPSSSLTELPSPSLSPSSNPSNSPSISPSATPCSSPSDSPTELPSASPSSAPSSSPSLLSTPVEEGDVATINSGGPYPKQLRGAGRK